MFPVIEALLVLQDRDRRLLRLRAEIDAIPVQRRVLSERSTTAQQTFDTVRHRAQQIESDRKKLELEVETLKQRISKVAAEQQTTRSNDQYKAYGHQIETIQAEIAKMDDQQLVLMEQMEAAAKEVAVAQKAALVQKAETEKQLQDMVEREASLRRELETVAAARVVQATKVDPAALSRYEAVARKRTDSTVVGVPKGVCGGCHMQLPQHIFLKAKGQQEIPACPNCTRLLYYSREMD
jgi:predicted  nucleic acid-binding Zn-ribbon protein